MITLLTAVVSLRPMVPIAVALVTCTPKTHSL